MINLPKIINILSNIILILSIVLDVLKDTNISSYVFLAICVFIFVFTIIKIIKQKTKISTFAFFTISGLLVIAYGVIDAFFPSIFNNNMGLASKFSLIIYFAFLMNTHIIDKRENAGRNTNDNTGDGSLC